MKSSDASDAPDASPGVTAIDPSTSVGPVEYAVSDLDATVGFYRNRLGFVVRERANDTARLGTNRAELVVLHERPDGRRIAGIAGLYHTAFLVPSRRDLAVLAERLLRDRTPLQGTNDHGTHLAIYLADNEGNGIELAWDRPREQWPFSNGRYQLERAPRGGLDLLGLAQEAPEPDADPESFTDVLPADTRIGHIHLHGVGIPQSIAFYHGILGFDVTVDRPDLGMMMVSAGGYHHHIGVNTWAGPHVALPPDDALGLARYTIRVPEAEELERLTTRLGASGIDARGEEHGIELRDPSGIEILITSSAGG